MQSAIANEPPRFLEWLDPTSTATLGGPKLSVREACPLSTLRILTLDPKPHSMVFGLHEVDATKESLRFERAMGWYLDANGHEAGSATRAAWTQAIREGVSSACSIARSYGKLDAVACADNGPCSIQSVEAASGALYGVPVVLVGRSEIENGANLGVCLARCVFEQFLEPCS